MALLVAGAAATTAGGCTSNHSPCSLTIDAARWRHAPYTRKRYEAAKRLVDCRDLIDGSKREVRALLGTPEKKHPRKWWYDAGYIELISGPGQGTSLEVFFDEGGHVRGALVPRYASFP